MLFETGGIGPSIYRIEYAATSKEPLKEVVAAMRTALAGVRGFGASFSNFNWPSGKRNLGSGLLELTLL